MVLARLYGADTGTIGYMKLIRPSLQSTKKIMNINARQPE